MSRLNYIACTCLWLLLTEGTALGADFFVATTGDDSGPGTESQPFQTLRAGMNAASNPGDTVYIRGGTYSTAGENWNNQLNLVHSGTSTAWITIRNYPGELPILDGSGLAGASGVEPNSEAVSYVRIQGLMAQNWATSGFSNGWNFPSSNMEFINCIADNNGVNGIAFYKASNVRIEGSIVAHNGNRDPSWSSGVNLFQAGGTNIIKGNVSFENIDISSNHSDGSGFILDEGSTHGEFVNNVAFLNGGSCIRLTNSSGARIFNNTCVNNAQDELANFNDEIYTSDATSSGAEVGNNAILPGPVMAFGGQGYTDAGGNVTVDASAFVSANGNLDFHLSGGASTLLDQAVAGNAPADDIGFDARCITSGVSGPHWWSYGPDLAYIESVGGVEGCFLPGARPAGSGMDVGAYESGATAEACVTDADCADADNCTNDTCQASGHCANLPIETCCTMDIDCADDDPCTLDACSVADGVCSNTVDPMCGESVSGEWSVDGGGYVSVCDWGGFNWGVAGPEEPGLNGTVSSITKTDLCTTGTVAAHEGYVGYALLGVNISQVNGEDTVAANIVPSGDGLNISVTNNTPSATLRVQLQDDQTTVAGHQWCVQLEGSGGFFPWSEFNTECWSADTGTAYAMEPINVIAVMVAGHNVDDVDFDFCLNQFSPSDASCVGSTPVSAAGGAMSTATGGATAAAVGGATASTPGDVSLGAGGSTADSATGDSGAVVASSCQAPLSMCSDTCVDINSDPLNCGGCSRPCDAGTVCSLGVCSSACGANLSACGQSCVDLQRDLLNCGGCNNVCLSGQTCSSGMCVGEAVGGLVSQPAAAPSGTVAPASEATASSCACRLTTRDEPPWGVILLGFSALVFGRRRRRLAFVARVMLGTHNTHNDSKSSRS